MIEQTKINLLQDNCCCYCEEEEEDSWVKVVVQCLQKSWTTTKENVRYVVPPRKSSLKLVNSALRRSHLYYQSEPAYKGVEGRKQVRVRLGIFRGLMRQRSRSDFDRLRRKRRNSPKRKFACTRFIEISLSLAETFDLYETRSPIGRSMDKYLSRK